MKKMFTLLVAAIFFSTVSFSQTAYKINDITTVDKSTPQFSLISNPVKGAINLKVSNPESTKYIIMLYSTTGQRITSVEYNHPGGISTETMYVPDGVSGMCYLVIKSQQLEKSLKVFIQS